MNLIGFFPANPASFSDEMPKSRSDEMIKSRSEEVPFICCLSTWFGLFFPKEQNKNLKKCRQLCCRMSEGRLERWSQGDMPKERPANFETGEPMGKLKLRPTNSELAPTLLNLVT